MSDRIGTEAVPPGKANGALQSKAKLGAVRYDFAPLPTRSLKDGRLTGDHYRVLGIIARHDGFGRNGTGCYAGLRTLAKETELDVDAVERLVADLQGWQYVLAKTSQRNQVRTTLCVMYTDEDKAVLRKRRAAPC